jgi:hypothetical protein
MRTVVFAGREAPIHEYAHTDSRVCKNLCLCERLPRTPFSGLVGVCLAERALKRTNERTKLSHVSQSCFRSSVSRFAFGRRR